ncbi:unnamed protein product [Parajaminaea phylloscopi]
MGAPLLDPSDPAVRLVQQYGPYGYQPKLAPAVVFTAAYAILAFVHLGLTIKSRQWWLIVVAIGAGLETAGNALRIYGHYNGHGVNPYIAMQCIVVVTPAFFAAMHFAILGKVLILFGRRFSSVPPTLIIPFFVSLDVASLAVQGAGSGIAATNEINGRDPRGGANLVVGGLSVQLLGYLIFDTLAILFASKVFSSQWQSKHGVVPAPHLWTRKMQIGIVMAFLSALLVLLRSCFRTGEMADGWIGRIAQREWYYYVFDATPVTLAVLLLAIWHPSQYLPLQISPPADEGEVDEGQREKAQGGTAPEADHTAASLQSHHSDGAHEGHAGTAVGTPKDKAGSFKSSADHAEQN